jgi:integrase
MRSMIGHLPATFGIMYAAPLLPRRKVVMPKKPGDPSRERLAKSIKRLLKRKAREREIYWDTTTRGFGLRLTPAGSATYVIGGRFGTKTFRRLEIGDARLMPFDEAEEKARQWLRIDDKGKDPRAVEAERVAAEAERKRQEERRGGHTVASIAYAFFRRKVIGPYGNKPGRSNKPAQRKWKEVKRHLRTVRARWGDRPIHSIRREELTAFIEERSSTPAETRNLLGVIKQLFSWARDRGGFGLEINIAADVKPSVFLGEKAARERALSTAEVRALWNAVASLKPPFRQAYQLLLLSGLRLSECTHGRWDEIDPKEKLWTVPGSRMKGRGKGHAFKVPLTETMIEILDSLPRVSDFIFSTNGDVPIALGDKIKKGLDAELKFKEPWQNHDLRRTLNTILVDELGVADAVANAALAHRKKGIEATYNRAEHVEPRRKALELYSEHVARNNVTPFPQGQRASG